MAPRPTPSRTYPVGNYTQRFSLGISLRGGPIKMTPQWAGSVLDHWFDMQGLLDPDNADEVQDINATVVSSVPAQSTIDLIVAEKFVSDGRYAGILLADGTAGQTYNLDVEISTMAGRMWHLNCAVRVLIGAVPNTSYKDEAGNIIADENNAPLAGV